jgi:hypothetical protein
MTIAEFGYLIAGVIAGVCLTLAVVILVIVTRRE